MRLVSKFSCTRLKKLNPLFKPFMSFTCSQMPSSLPWAVGESQLSHVGAFSGSRLRFGQLLKLKKKIFICVLRERHFFCSRMSCRLLHQKRNLKKLVWIQKSLFDINTCPYTGYSVETCCPISSLLKGRGFQSSYYKFFFQTVLHGVVLVKE